MQPTEQLANAASWAIVVGFIQPIVLQFLLQAKWSAKVQAVLAFLFSMVVGTFTAFFAGAFDSVQSVVSIALLVAVVSIASYRGFWKAVTPNMKLATSIDEVNK